MCKLIINFPLQLNPYHIQLMYLLYVQSFTIIDRALSEPEAVIRSRFFERLDIELSKTKGVNISQIDMVSPAFYTCSII